MFFVSCSVIVLNAGEGEHCIRIYAGVNVGVHGWLMLRCVVLVFVQGFVVWFGSVELFMCLLSNSMEIVLSFIILCYYLLFCAKRCDPCTDLCIEMHCADALRCMSFNGRRMSVFLSFCSQMKTQISLGF